MRSEKDGIGLLAKLESKNSKLSVIDKIHVNGGLLFKEAVCRDSRQGVGYKVIE